MIPSNLTLLLRDLFSSLLRALMQPFLPSQITYVVPLFLPKAKKPGTKKIKISKGKSKPFPFTTGQVIQHKERVSVKYLILSEPEFYTRRQRRWTSGTYFKVKVMMLRGKHKNINGKIRYREFFRKDLKNFKVVVDVDIPGIDTENVTE